MSYLRTASDSLHSRPKNCTRFSDHQLGRWPFLRPNVANSNVAQAQVIANSGHDDMIVRSTTAVLLPCANASYQHDAVLDYYGRRLATCSSDKTIKIFEIEGDQHRLTETLKGYV
jgi:hypothetical protein